MSNDRKQQILVVDDEMINITVLVSLLRDEYKIVVAKSGEQALKRAISDNPPDLILLDVRMPGIDGFEVCQRLKNDDRTQNIPVIFITAQDAEQEEARGFEVGAADYISKPFSPSIVKARVANHLEFKRKERELISLNKQKDKFFSIIAHDLKSPFNALIGFSDMLSSAATQGDAACTADYASLVHQSAETVFKLLENLLEWSRLQMNQLEFDPVSINLHTIIEENLDLFTPIAANKKIRLIANESRSFEVIADIHMVNTVIRNLINNAIKFTHSGGEVSVAVKTNESNVEILVTDNGVGINGEKLEKLFDLGEKTSTSGTAGEAGTGLGLQLCKELVEQLGGALTVESMLGEGSTFCFTLPWLPSEH